MTQLDLNDLDRVLRDALAEDLGKGDITSQITIPPQAQITARFITRQDAVACGLPAVARLFGMLGEGTGITTHVPEGERMQAGTVMATVSGNARMILAGERVALNLLQRLCAIATLSRRYADAAAGTKVKVLDTRKTTPGLRLLEKYAVAIGGCTNHRLRLDDGIMIKDNHIRICGGITQAIDAAQNNLGPWLATHTEFTGHYPIQVECDTLEQVEKALAAGVPGILLDNMDNDTLKKAVAMTAGRAVLEASGGMTLERIRSVAETGVDTISVGALTHSVAAVDIGLDMD